MSDLADDDKFVPMHPMKVIVIMIGIALGFFLATYIWPLEDDNKNAKPTQAATLENPSENKETPSTK